MGTLRPFNALNGTEVKKAILKEIERHLDNDFRFRANVAYPLISWRWKLAANIYPGEPANWDVNVGPVTQLAPPNEDGKRPPMPQDGDPVVEVDLQGGSTVGAGSQLGGQTPDALRRDAGLPLPSPRRVVGPGDSRVTVDAPLDTGKASAAQTADLEPVSVTNENRGGRVFARSVTARTKAAPTGAEVAPAAGSSPTHSAEDIQKILENEASAPKD